MDRAAGTHPQRDRYSARILLRLRASGRPHCGRGYFQRTRLEREHHLGAADRAGPPEPALRRAPGGQPPELGQHAADRVPGLRPEPDVHAGRGGRPDIERRGRPERIAVRHAGRHRQLPCFGAHQLLGSRAKPRRRSPARSAPLASSPKRRATPGIIPSTATPEGEASSLWSSTISRPE